MEFVNDVTKPPVGSAHFLKKIKLKLKTTDFFQTRRDCTLAGDACLLIRNCSKVDFFHNMGPLNHNSDIHNAYFAKCQLQALRPRCVHVSVHEKDTASSPTSPLSLSKHSRVSERQTCDVDQNSCGVTLLQEQARFWIFAFKLLLSGRDVEVLCPWISTWTRAVAFGAGWALLGRTFLVVAAVYLRAACLKLCFCCFLSPGDFPMALEKGRV